MYHFDVRDWLSDDDGAIICCHTFSKAHKIFLDIQGNTWLPWFVSTHLPYAKVQAAYKTPIVGLIKLQSSSSHRHTDCTATEWNLWETHQLEGWLLHIGQVRKYPLGQERLGHTLTINPTPRTAPFNWEGASHSQLLPKDGRIFDPLA